MPRRCRDSEPAPWEPAFDTLPERLVERARLLVVPDSRDGMTAVVPDADSGVIVAILRILRHEIRELGCRGGYSRTHFP